MRLSPGLRLSPLLAIAAFVWGVYTYRDTAQRQLASEEAQAKRTEETRRIEATRPFLDKQLALYTEATRVVAIIATSRNAEQVKSAQTRFYELYWGDLALVEHGDVSAAMATFRSAMNEGRDPDKLGPLALKLAHACRDELATSWGTDAWRRVGNSQETKSLGQ